MLTRRERDERAFRAGERPADPTGQDERVPHGNLHGESKFHCIVTHAGCADVARGNTRVKDA